MVFAARCLVTVLRDTPVSRAISRIDSFCRKCIRWMMFNSPMWITPLPPPLTASGVGSHGSVLSENYAPNRLTSGWKSTGNTFTYAAKMTKFLQDLKMFQPQTGTVSAER
jgi:hypothetical protein